MAVESPKFSMAIFKDIQGNGYAQIINLLQKDRGFRKEEARSFRDH